MNLYIYIFFVVLSLAILFFGGLATTKTIKKGKSRTFSLISVLVVFFACIGLSSYSYFIDSSTQETELTKYTYKQVDRNVKQEKTKQEALNSLISMLKAFQDDPSKSTDLKTRFVSLSNDTGNLTKYVTDEALSYLYLTDTMKTDNINSTSVLTILGVLNILEQTGNTNFEAKLTNVEQFIYLDETTGTAHIPLDIFTSSSTAMSFEMVYVNNQWKFAPYSFIQSIQLSDQIQNSLSSTTSSSTQGE